MIFQKHLLRPPYENELKLSWPTCHDSHPDLAHADIGSL